jgi:hypothetical protein
VLAYVFWHSASGDVAAYEERLRAFHDVIGVPSAWFRVSGLPWIPGGDGYEDWYLVEDWAALGALQDRAVSGARRELHDAAAAGTAWGTAGLYALRRGEPILRTVRFAAWRSKPAGLGYACFEPSLPGAAVWQRQMTLGPSPEYALHDVEPVEGEIAVAYG